MLTEQSFKSKGPGRICIPITGSFHDKAINSKENIRLNCYLLQEAIHFTFPYLGQITYKI